MKFAAVKSGISCLFIFLSCISFASCIAVQGAEKNNCAGIQKAVVIDAEREHMWLCQSGSSYKDYSVAIGSSGAGKREEGDDKSPLGRYTLGTPRPSGEGFHTFIPINFPREDQKKQGFTGGRIGIHGPPENWRWLRAATTWVNWTRGCIAVGTVGEIIEVADWVRNNQVTDVIILPEHS